MKEYKSLQVYPDEVDECCNTYATFGWALESSQEVYNESEEIVGIEQNTKATVYGDGFFGGFMRGFTGNDGHATTETKVHTRKNVTHYFSLRFSRDNTMKHYDRIVELEDEYYGTNPKQLPIMNYTKKPIALTVVFTIVTFFMVIYFVSMLASPIEGAPAPLFVMPFLPIVGLLIPTIIMWVKYNKKHPKEVKYNEEAKKQNEENYQAYLERMSEICNEASQLVNAE